LIVHRPARSVTLNICCVIALIGAVVRPASAQGRWTGRGRVGFNGGVQADTGSLSQSLTLTKNAESAPVTAELASAVVPLVEGGLVVRVAGNFGAGVAISSLTRTDDADIAARIPHLFFFNQQRQISGTAPLEHKELATHVSAVYVLIGQRVDASLSAGLSWFRADQDFIEDVIYTEAYPYDEVTFASARLAHESRSKAGFHAGVDVAWKLGRQWGVGGLVRFSRATIPFNTLSMEVGGLQAGGGLRLMF
jgi:hypothetical protein